MIIFKANIKPCSKLDDYNKIVFSPNQKISNYFYEKANFTKPFVDILQQYPSNAFILQIMLPSYLLYCPSITA